jgi:predicted alpha/beta hydrolase
MRRITPEQLGAPRIGHFGFFRERFQSSLWPHVTQWLQQHFPHPQETPA